MKGASHECFKYKLRLWGGGSEAREGVLAPVEYEQQTEKHAAKMREVGYAVGKKETFEQLDSSIANDEPFGFDGHKEIEVDALFGEKHSEGQQDAVDGSRSAHGKAPAGNEQVAKPCANAADEVVDQEAARAPIVFQYIAEHPKSEHIENYVAPVGVHEHVGEELPDAETAGGHGVEGQHGGDIVEAVAFQHHGGKENDEVDDEQVFDYRRQHAETLGGVLAHRVMFLLFNRLVGR